MRWVKKLSSQLSFIASKNTDGLYRFHISQGSVPTQLRCGGKFSSHFIANFAHNAPVKKSWKLVNIWQRYWQKFVAYFRGHPIYATCMKAIKPIDMKI